MRNEWDTLTGQLKGDALRQELNRKVFSGEKLGLLLLDLDRFRRYNHIHGYGVGDTLLISIAQSIHQLLAEGDLLARPSGDEFLVLMSGAPARWKGLAEAIRAILAKGPVTVSGGLVTHPLDGHNYEELLRRADFRLFLAKRLGGNVIVSEGKRVS